jgi:hypothetical protein
MEPLPSAEEVTAGVIASNEHGAGQVDAQIDADTTSQEG